MRCSIYIYIYNIVRENNVSSKYKYIVFFQMNELASSMESTYSTAKICKYGEDLDNCNPTLSLGGKY